METLGKRRNGELETARYRSTLVFPLTNKEGEIVAYYGRAIDDIFIDSFKILKGDKSLGVFQTPHALKSDVIATIVECPVDTMAPDQCGMPCAALIGTSAGDGCRLLLPFAKC